MPYDQKVLLADVRAALGAKRNADLARMWGLDNAHFSQYESGVRRMDDYALARCAEALGVDPMELIAARELHREPTGERLSFWKRFAKKVLSPRTMLKALRTARGADRVGRDRIGRVRI